MNGKQMPGSGPEVELRRECKDLAEILDTLRDAVTVQDLDFNIILANKAAKDLLGRTAGGDIIGKKCFNCFHGAAGCPENCPADSVLKTGDPVTFGIFEPHLNRELEIQISPRRDKDNRLDGLLHVVRDITARKTIERRQELSMAVLKCLADGDNRSNIMHEILIIVRRLTAIEAAGIRLKAGEDYFYYSAEGFPEESANTKNSLCARHACCGPVRGAAGPAGLEGMCGNVISGRTDPSLPFFTKAGSFWTNSTTDLIATTTPEQRQAYPCDCCNTGGYESVALIPLRSRERVIGLLQLNDRRKDQLTLDLVEFFEELGASIGIALGRSIAAEEKAKLEEQLRQAQKMEVVGRLACGVAHDFNNILTAITTYAEFIRRALAPGDPKLADAQEILTAAARAVALTRQLLAFSRKQVLAPHVVDLNGIVGAMTKMLRHLIRENVKLEIRLANRPCLVKVDTGQFEQVVMNLVVNACDAMPGGGTLTLETGIIEAAEELFKAHPNLPCGPLVCLKVSDTGAGMSAEVQKHIFEPFFTTKEAGKGTGLGLATAFGIIKQSGGEVVLKSALGEGTTFSVYLPLEKAGLQDKGKDGEKDKEPSVKGRETVLFVEDDATLRRLGERILRTAGYSVLAAADGRDAVKVLEQYGKPADLLVTDVVMPGISGRDLALDLTSRKLVSRTLYMSGYTNDAILQHGVLEPGIAFIYKPFTVAEILEKLREVLDGPADQAKA